MTQEERRKQVMDDLSAYLKKDREITEEERRAEVVENLRVYLAKEKEKTSQQLDDQGWPMDSDELDVPTDPAWALGIVRQDQSTMDQETDFIAHEMLREYHGKRQRTLTNQILEKRNELILGGSLNSVFGDFGVRRNSGDNRNAGHHTGDLHDSGVHGSSGGDIPMAMATAPNLNPDRSTTECPVAPISKASMLRPLTKSVFFKATVPPLHWTGPQCPVQTGKDFDGSDASHSRKGGKDLPGTPPRVSPFDLVVPGRGIPKTPPPSDTREWINSGLGPRHSEGGTTGGTGATGWALLTPVAEYLARNPPYGPIPGAPVKPPPPLPEFLPEDTLTPPAPPPGLPLPKGYTGDSSRTGILFKPTPIEKPIWAPSAKQIARTQARSALRDWCEETEDKEKEVLLGNLGKPPPAQSR